MLRLPGCVLLIRAKILFSSATDSCSGFLAIGHSCGRANVPFVWVRRILSFRHVKGEAPTLVDLSKLSRDEAEVARHYPPSSIGSAWQKLIKTPEWSGRALSTRNKVWWPAWFRIRDMFGDCAPDTVTFDMMSKWRAALERNHGRSVAHKTIKVWRAFWNIMLGMKVARGPDPSKGVRNRSPNPRHQKWHEGEAVRLVKSAWRSGYRGLACIVAIAWDTGFSPVDVRTLAERHRAAVGNRLIFDLEEDGRAKTGRAVVGTISRRTERLVVAYLAELGTERLPEAVLFRTRTGKAYQDARLSRDFEAIRNLTFPGDARHLADMRRSGVVEAVAGDATPIGLSNKLANSIDRSNTLHKTYSPTNIDAILSVDEARLKGRRKIRAGNESRVKVSPQQPGEVSPTVKGASK